MVEVFIKMDDQNLKSINKRSFQEKEMIKNLFEPFKSILDEERLPNVLNSKGKLKIVLILVIRGLYSLTNIGNLRKDMNILKAYLDGRLEAMW